MTPMLRSGEPDDSHVRLGVAGCSDANKAQPLLYKLVLSLLLVKLFLFNAFNLTARLVCRPNLAPRPDGRFLDALFVSEWFPLPRTLHSISSTHFNLTVALL